LYIGSVKIFCPIRGIIIIGWTIFGICIRNKNAIVIRMGLRKLSVIVLNLGNITSITINISPPINPAITPKNRVALIKPARKPATVPSMDLSGRNDHLCFPKFVPINAANISPKIAIKAIAINACAAIKIVGARSKKRIALKQRDGIR